MIADYINRNKFNVNKDYAENYKNHLLYKYKLNLLKANGFNELAEKLTNTSPQFKNLEESNYDNIVDDVYPMSLETEKQEIEKTFKNLEYLSESYKIFEFCRARCKVMKMLNKNFVAYPAENQMCLADCLNVRFEKFEPEKPETNNDETSQKKTFVWLA